MSYVQSNARCPRHIAIIMDGNGRWAKKRKLPRIAGHKVGVDSVRAIVRACSDKGIEVLTLFAFSVENWKRSKEEVGFLMRLFIKVLEIEAKKLHKEKVCIRFIGDLESLDSKLQKVIKSTEDLTKKNTGLKLVIAINYSGKWDITNAARNIAAKLEKGELLAKDISIELFNAYTQLSDLPPPDLLIRTSGELRISNFMLWQLAYTELYFTECLWPDFREAELDAALLEYSKRERRFGDIK